MNFTKEQLAVINHPKGHHARVLAVAGSGKTSTMAYRIKNLVDEQSENSENILVLMFNRLAREQFSQRLYTTGLFAQKQPKVYTFHAFAYRFITQLKRVGLIAHNTDLWIGARAEVEKIYISRAIEHLEQRNVIKTSEIGLNSAMDAISLWKSFLIPPEQAGHHVNQDLTYVYAEFESLRTQKNALTFDDFVPLAIQLLTTDAQLNSQWCDRMDHVIVDEYQDVNYGQQRLIELLTGQRADLMVVGDDDQTIYEWRGARPQYITGEFQTVFDNKPQIDYTLSHSFRFGPVLAQAAYNCISQNKLRVPKPLLAHFIQKETSIQIYQMQASESYEVAKLFTNQLISLVLEQQVVPNQIAVLARLYAQLVPVEIELLNRKVPYTVIGNKPFFRRSENAALIHYLQVALQLYKPVTKESTQWFMAIINKPLRYLPRRELESALDFGRMFQHSFKDILTSLAENSESPLKTMQRYELIKLIEILKRINILVSEDPLISVGKLLDWLVDEIEYLKQFENYYGEGESSFERQLSVKYFLLFINQTKYSVEGFIEFLNQLDITQGAKPENQVVLTSIYKVKGLEFDFVFIPQCFEGQLPYLRASENTVFDVTEQIETSDQSPPMERERRLFYVALTRAKKAVFLESTSYLSVGSQLPSRFLEEVQLSDTQEIFEPYQHLIAYPDSDASLLVDPLRQLSVPQIIDTLQNYYLTSFSYEWVKEANKIVDNLFPKTFAYQLNYEEIVSTQNKKDVDLDVPWHYLRLELEKKNAEKGMVLDIFPELKEFEESKDHAGQEVFFKEAMLNESNVNNDVINAPRRILYVLKLRINNLKKNASELDS